MRKIGALGAIALLGIVACSSNATRSEGPLAVAPAETRLLSNGHGLGVRWTNPEALEVIEPRKEGVELSFRFDRAPRSRVVRVSLDAVPLGRSLDGVRFRDPAGTTWLVGEATWIDAKGRRTPIATRLEGGALVYDIPEDLALRSSYPALLDPLFSTEIELDTPTLGAGSGTMRDGRVAWTGSRFLAAWTTMHGLTFAGRGPARVRVTTVPASGDPELGITLGSGRVTGFAATSSQSLVLFLDKNEALRGALLDATLKPIGSSVPVADYCVQARAAFDGTQWLIACTVVEDIGVYKMSTAGVVGSVGKITKARDGELSCTSAGACLVSYSAGDTNQTSVRKVDGTSIGSSVLTLPNPTSSVFNPRIASSGAGHLVIQNDSTLLRAFRTDGVSFGLSSDLASGSIGSASVVGDAGGFLSVWFSNTDVFAARIGTTGAPAPTWTSKIATGANVNNGPYIVAGSDGSSAVVARGHYQPLAELLAARIALGSAPSTPTWFSIPRGAPGQFVHTLSSDGDKHLAVWSEQRGASYELRARLFDAAGKALGSPVTLTSFTGGDYPLDLTSTYDGKRHHVVYRRFHDYLEQSLEVVRVDAAGAAIDTIPRVLGAGGYLSTGATIAAGNDRALLAWIDASSLFVRRFDALGVPLAEGPQAVAPVAMLTDVSVPGNHVSVSFDGKRFLVVHPVASGASSDLAGVFVDDKSISAPITVATLPGSQGEVGAASNGEVHLVAWVDTLPGSRTIRAARVALDGKVLDADPPVVFRDVCATCAPTVRWDGSSFLVAAQGDGGSMVADGDALVGRELRVARVRADGVVADEPVVSLTKDAFVPFLSTTVAMSSDGKGHSLVGYARLNDAAPVFSSRVALRALSAKRPAGSTCAAAGDCDDGFCVDGVCCKSACEGTCEACNTEGALGTCKPVAGKPRGARTCGASTDFCAEATCDGMDGSKCASFRHGDGDVCGAAACAGNDFVGASKCSAAHACVAPAKVACAPYRCAASGCLATCASNTDCVGTASCVAGSCVKSPSGRRCSDDQLSSVDEAGAVQSCVPYRCNTDGACAKQCVTTSDCVPGYACNGATCEPLPTESSEDGGGCTTGRRASGGGWWVALLGAVFAARRRRALLGAATMLVAGCRAESVEPRLEGSIGQGHASLVVSAESVLAETDTEVGAPGSGAIACNTSGCLLVQRRVPWIVARRLKIDGTPIDTHGVVLAEAPAAYGPRQLAVGTDGTDFLVAWERDALPIAWLRVGADGKAVGTPAPLSPASAFVSGISVGFDGKTWVVTWTEGLTGKYVATAARIQKDGTRLDPIGSPLITFDKPSFSVVPATVCDGSGCTVVVSAGTPSQIVRVVDGKVSGTPLSIPMRVKSITRFGTDLLVAGSDTTGNLLAASIAADGSAIKIAPKVLDAFGTDEIAVGVTASQPMVVARQNGPVTTIDVIRLDGTLSVADKKLLSVDVDAFSQVPSTTVGGTMRLSSGSAMWSAASTSSFTRWTIESRGAAQRLARVASDGSTSVVTYVRGSSVFVARLTGGVLATPVLVGTATGVIDLDITWDGAQYVVGWTDGTNVACKRVSAALAVTDLVATTISSSGDSSFLRFGVGTSGAIAFLAPAFGDLRSVRIDRSTGKTLDTTPNVLAAAGFGLAATSRGGTTLLSWMDLSAYPARLSGLRVGSDGKAVDTKPRTLAEDFAGRDAEPVLASDATGWWVGWSSETPGIGRDVRLAHYATDLSDAPSAGWLVSTRDPAQASVGLALDGTKAMVTWVDRATKADEVRTSWVDLSTRKVLVDAALVGSFGVQEIGSVFATSLVGSKGELLYVRNDPDPSILAPRLRARTATFGALKGQACTTTADCELGSCVDGVCCDRPCDGVCESCNEPGAVGICTTIAGKPRGARTCGGEAGCAEKACDGYEPRSCARYLRAFETSCAASKCEGAIYTAASYCDGRGGCGASSPVSCAPYACDPSGCLSSCVDDKACATGFACKDGHCVQSDLKATCVDDGLSSQSAAGTRKSCAPYRCGAEGTCLTRCTSSLECQPGAACDVGSGVCSVPSTGDDGGGCSFGSSGADSGWFLVFAGLLGTALRRRRS